MSEAVLKLSGISRSYQSGSDKLEVLKSAGLEICPGEVVALVAPSGTGKSTMLHLAGLLERPDSGDVEIAGQNCTKLSDRKRTLIRRHEVGFVYQFHHLQGEFSALENVVLPQMIAGVKKREAAERASGLLEAVGLKDRIHHRPAKLSGGEQQRVAIVRALANGPKLLLADEPTGNLDPNTSDAVFEVLIKLVRENGMAALIATHNLDLAGKMDRLVSLKDGKVVAA
ncbi:ABC transporter ATP-binding protein [Aestuariispira insulae]|uniref:Lipoprotein-releasing system ATP-binding protein n=1 Tax=Aestuariispira insulae TaxID=1461337 RepID=A0A3D9HV65_9PROT|nr:ABC transporter ATP-binding protein [Aestuariispira insulae]RED53305.1 lipoprotein-releasing system ATP-binding protein [Aestuariispira insulae]